MRARAGGRWRSIGPGLVVVLLGACVWWGVHPPRTEETYRQESAHTVELLRSQVETARIWLEEKDAGKVTTFAVEVALTETETDAESVLSGYAAHQPPGREATRLRGDVTALGDRVVALLGSVRVDARAGRWAEAVAAAEDLAALSRELRVLRRRALP